MDVILPVNVEITIVPSVIRPDMTAREEARTTMVWCDPLGVIFDSKLEAVACGAIV